jgi:hypothetical protein
MSSYGPWIGFIENSLEHTPIVQSIWKWTNYVETKLSTWHDISDLNMNKRSSCNNLETIRSTLNIEFSVTY